MALLSTIRTGMWGAQLEVFELSGDWAIIEIVRECIKKLLTLHGSCGLQGQCGLYSARKADSAVEQEYLPCNCQTLHRQSLVSAKTVIWFA
jgi:hypothetical protein